MDNVMIITGESSGELYGSLLAGELKKRRHDIHITGVGGERMAAAGVELISRIAGAFGLLEAVSAFGKIRRTFSMTVRALKESRPQVVVLIDYPDFNLKVAAAAKSLGIKVLYYVSPQVWAWRKGRVKKIARLVDRMAVILPFEQEIYRNTGLPCEFVGHPILEEIEAVLTQARRQAREVTKESRAYFKDVLGFDPARPLLSLLPGSRPSELNRHFPLITDVVREFRSDAGRNSGEDYQFCIPLAPNTDQGKYHEHLEALRSEDVVIKEGESIRVLSASDMAVVASGTATLQSAFLEVPMVVIYKLSALSYHLGRRILDVKYISLVNILSGEEVVKELIQEMANPHEIVRELKSIMSDTVHREKMLLHYKKLKEPFMNKTASQRVADIVMELAGDTH
jgi:lipid-A-disaccharide synthase